MNKTTPRIIDDFGKCTLPYLGDIYPWLATASPSYCSEECALHGWEQRPPQWVGGFFLSTALAPCAYCGEKN